MLLNGFIGRAAMTGFITLKALATPVAFGVSALALNRDGKVLLVRHSYQPGWMLPGGGVGRAEPPTDAILRELREEVGLTDSLPPEFFALYTRKAGWATNMVAVYRVGRVEIAFRPNFEIVEARFFDPLELPSQTTAPTRRRVSEMLGTGPRPSFW